MMTTLFGGVLGVMHALMREIYDRGKYMRPDTYSKNHHGQMYNAMQSPKHVKKKNRPRARATTAPLLMWLQ